MILSDIRKKFIFKNLPTSVEGKNYQYENTSYWRKNSNFLSRERNVQNKDTYNPSQLDLYKTTIDYHVKVNGQWHTTKTTSKQLEGNEEGKCKVKRIREENHPGFQISPWGDGLCGAQNCKK